MRAHLQHDVGVNGSSADSTGGHQSTRTDAAPGPAQDRPRAAAGADGAASAPRRRGGRVRMTGKQRREQLLEIGRTVFAERGYDGTSVEEIAERAGVSKPVVYEHFGGKEGLYAVVVDREMQLLLDMVTGALTGGTRASCWSRRRSR